MEEWMVLVIAAAVVFAFSGPAAFIISLIALGKLNTLEEKLRQLSLRTKAAASADQQAVKPILSIGDLYPPAAPPKPAADLVEPAIITAPAPIAPPIQPDTPLPQEVCPPMPAAAGVESPIVMLQAAARPTLPHTDSLEQQIGTRWVLFAGIIVSLIGACLFLKYMYDRNIMGPWVRVGIVAGAGLLSFIIGEITRRRGYEIVAKGVGAMGFALLYASVFSAYRFYDLIGVPQAFGAAIVITIAAMAYAVILNEVAVAILSLLGGYATPLIVSTGRNLPHHLFGYVLILSLGAMGCAAFRRWRGVNVLAFFSTFLLYTLWFEKFCRPMLAYAEAHPGRIWIAEVWLWVFFAVFLIMPALYGFMRKITLQKEDAVLTVLCGVGTFYYLASMLFEHFRTELVISTAILGAVYLAMAAISRLRCAEDTGFRAALITTAVAFITAAIGMYFKMYALPLCWAIEAVALTAVGVWFASILTQGLGLIAMGLAVSWLLQLLPLHPDGTAFSAVFNGVFGTWVFVSACVLAMHWFYRIQGGRTKPQAGPLAEILYVIGLGLAGLACQLEWSAVCQLRYEAVRADRLELLSVPVILSLLTIVMSLRPLCPKGVFTTAAGGIAATAGAAAALYAGFDCYTAEFRLVFNDVFAVQCVWAACILISALLLKAKHKDDKAQAWPAMFGFGLVIVVWLFLTQQVYLYWYCQGEYAHLARWKTAANMWVSLLWAGYGAGLLILGFARKLPVLRFLALGLFGLLLLKIFAVDMATVKNFYRIIAFVTTGLVLVTVSYLYQFLRKKGFFDALDK